MKISVTLGGRSLPSGTHSSMRAVLKARFKNGPSTPSSYALQPGYKANMGRQPHCREDQQAHQLRVLQPASGALPRGKAPGRHRIRPQAQGVGAALQRVAAVQLQWASGPCVPLPALQLLLGRQPLPAAWLQHREHACHQHWASIIRPAARGGWGNTCQSNSRHPILLPEVWASPTVVGLGVCACAALHY